MGVDASYRSLQEEGGDRGGELLLPSGGGTAGEPPPPKASQAEAEDSKEICGRHEVVAGDSLWTIASRVLDTDDPRRIARYWPRLHRANRALIGSNPDLIRPGWVLTLPGECD
jgi:nucleoid-associated protein YgaU